MKFSVCRSTMRVVFSLVFLLNILNLSAQVTNCFRSQKQADIWYFGEKAGIDFASGTAVAITDQNVMSSKQSSAIICDSMGVIRFFTDGKTIWDRTFVNPPYAPSMEGSTGCTQPCIIVPRPGDSNQFYIFTVDQLAYFPSDTNNVETNGFKVSLFNMNGNNGLGDGTIRWNMPLLAAVSQKLTGTRNSNNIDYWVITHGWDDNAFYAFPVTEEGIGTPVVSHTGTVHGNGRTGQVHLNDVGAMKCSPDGTKIALAVSGKNLVELFNFNATTGVVSTPSSYLFNVQEINPYGIEFSSDNSKLYTTLFKLAGWVPTRASRLYQFDLNNGLVNPVLIDSVPGIRIGGMQLATDGRIYITRTINHSPTKDSLDVIYNPTRPGLECNYNKLNGASSSFSLLGRKGIYGLPNFIQSYFNRPLFRHDSVCDRQITQFTITNKANIDSVVWDFGDGATSTALDALHKYAPGKYTVKLTEIFNGISYQDSVKIDVFQVPDISLGGDTVLMYQGSSLNLYAGEGYRDYLWSNNSKNNSINVESGGNFWARVMDDHCCYNSDTVFVNVFEYYAPTAFTPNNDGLNDEFRIIGLYQNITFDMLIYDRWGKLCFESTDLSMGWDGKINGQPAPSGTYAWIVNIGFPANDIVTNGKVVLKGTVMLLK